MGKKTFLNDDFNVSNKQVYNLKQSPKHEIYKSNFHKSIINPNFANSSKVIPQFNFNLNQPDTANNSKNNKDKDSSDNIESVKTDLFDKKNNNKNSKGNIFELEGGEESKSLNSSFNEDSLKNLVSNRISNKYIIPPCFLKIEDKDLKELTK